MKSKRKIILILIAIFGFFGAYPLVKRGVFKGYCYVTSLMYRPDVLIQGPIVMADGIGRQTVELARVLAKKHRVQIRSKYVNKNDMPSSILSMLKTQYKQPARVAIVEESLWAPRNGLDRFFPSVHSGDQIRYAYSMLESTRIIPEWVMMLNLYFDAVIVPDPFLIEAYVTSGVTVPVFYIPLGLDIHPFLHAPLKQAKKKGPFVFATLGTAIDRKNHIMTIRAFAQAFGNDKNVQLHINCREGRPEVREEIVNEIVKQNCGNIKFTELRLKKDAYLKFFQSVDCLLSLSKGEGFAIQPREAMALGIPAIVTDNTAQSTICKSGLVKVVSSNIAEPAYYFGRSIPDGERFNCAIEDCVAAMQDMYHNYGKYLEKGPAMREWARAYDYSHLSHQYECLVAPKQIVLGDEDKITADCIYTSSRALYEKYLNLQASR